MRVAIATVQVPYLSGGAEALAEGLRTAIATEGHPVEIVTLPFRFFPPEEVERAIARWTGDKLVRGLPSAPERPVIVASDPDRPQPRRDVNCGNGMSVVVGRVRPDPVFDVKLVAMGHNIIRGAAGASVLNAELLARGGLLSDA